MPGSKPAHRFRFFKAFSERFVQGRFAKRLYGDRNSSRREAIVTMK